MRYNKTAEQYIDEIVNTAKDYLKSTGKVNWTQLKRLNPELWAKWTKGGKFKDYTVTQRYNRAMHKVKARDAAGPGCRVVFSQKPVKTILPRYCPVCGCELRAIIAALNLGN